MFFDHHLVVSSCFCKVFVRAVPREYYFKYLQLCNIYVSFTYMLKFLAPCPRTDSVKNVVTFCKKTVDAFYKP